METLTVNATTGAAADAAGGTGISNGTTKSGININKVIKVVKEYISYPVAIALFIIIAVINPMFASANNLSNILSDMSALLLLSIGVTFVLLIGSIDLSIGAMSSCACVIFAMTIPNMGWMGLILALLFGTAAGLVSGVIYVKTKIPSFITTFGTMSVWQSLALIISKGAPQQISGHYREYVIWFRDKIGIIPVPFIIAAVVFIIFLVIEKKTKFGRTLYAIGGNESTARTVGMNIDATKIAVFGLMGLLSALAGIFFACNMRSGIPTVGEPFTLSAIAAVALGGTSLSGGKGGLLRSFAGVLLVILIQNGMNVIGVGVFWQKITFGAIILIAIFVTTDRKQRDLVVK
ncbi:MAG: ABC transporter permease [Clostridiales Family XIII bacterium]|nr:ABC transporter permease [Clostridiales Family XIII bacterium]